MSEYNYQLHGKRVWVAGHRGMVGSAVKRRLKNEECDILTAGREQVNLLDQQQVQNYIKQEKPDAIVLAAAVVGGIFANQSYPVKFLYENLAIESNIIHAAHENDVNRLLFLGSSCIYPKFAPQPITEDALMTGALEPTNQWYAIAKISGIYMAQAYREQYGREYISAMPTNLYGFGDNFDLESSHVLPALMRKVHEAKGAKAESVTIWGTGTPKREFLHADDCADALVYLLKHYDETQHINVGSGKDIAILDLAKLVCEIVGFEGAIKRDLSKPDGTPRKLMSASKISKLGWKPSIPLEQGIKTTYDWFLNNHTN